MARLVNYEDEDGFLWLVAIPDDAPDSAASMGVPIGPPDLSSLNLPLETARRLNLQLHARGLFTAKDLRKRHHEIFAALQAALRVDTTTIVNLYLEE
jgi:hypothetical protein